MFGSKQMTSSALESCFAEDARACAWSTLRSLTHEMLDAAQAGEWDRVRHIEPDRRQRMERFFSAGVASGEVELVRDGIIDMLASDQELLRLRRGYKRKRPANIIQFRRRVSAKRA